MIRSSARLRGGFSAFYLLRHPGKSRRAYEGDREAAGCSYRGHRESYFESQCHIRLVMVYRAQDQQNKTEKGHRGKKGDNARNQSDRQTEKKSAHENQFRLLDESANSP